MSDSLVGPRCTASSLLPIVSGSIQYTIPSMTPLSAADPSHSATAHDSSSHKQLIATAVNASQLQAFPSAIPALRTGKGNNSTAIRAIIGPLPILEATIYMSSPANVSHFPCPSFRSAAETQSTSIEQICSGKVLSSRPLRPTLSISSKDATVDTKLSTKTDNDESSAPKSL